VTKKTPLEEFEDAKLTALEKRLDDADKVLKAETDPTLTRDQRLKIFKDLQMWPRIVLGLYRAELAAAQKEREKEREIHGVPEYGREMPSEIARRVVGEAIELGADRVRDLCREGQEHLNQGLTPRPEIRAAEFIKILRHARG
jgi:hypothetical protein